MRSKKDQAGNATRPLTAPSVLTVGRGLRPRIGFEAEVMFDREGYPELAEEIQRRGWDWCCEDVEAPWALRRLIATDLSRQLGRRVIAPNRRTLRSDRPTNRWAVKPEYDVEHAIYEDMLTAVEIVTPPLRYGRARSALSKLVLFLLERYGRTVEGTGLHMSIDCPPLAPLSALRLALELDEEAILSNFERSGRALLVPQRHHLLVEAVAALLEGDPLAVDPDFLAARLGRSKRFALNFAKLDSAGYLEFRHCGGPDYIWRFPDLLDTLDLFLEAIDDAADQAAPRPETWSSFLDDVEAVFEMAIRLEQRELEGRRPGQRRWRFLLDDELVAIAAESRRGEFAMCLHPPRRGAWSTGLEPDTSLKRYALAALHCVRGGLMRTPKRQKRRSRRRSCEGDGVGCLGPGEAPTSTEPSGEASARG